VNRTAWVYVLALAAACGGESASPSPASEIDGKQQPIVYGEDDRLDVYEYDKASVRERVKASAVALIEPRYLQRPASGRVSVSATALGKAYQLCDGERFVEQPAGADCSATLIDDDLVLTAGHCFDDKDTCDMYAYVFDFFYNEKGQLETLSAADVYGCRDFVVRQVSPMRDFKQFDYAIVQLDRPALAPRKPAPISMRTMTKGEAVIALGFTSGLPAKIDDGARVIDPRGSVLDYFKLDTDTFAGSSGSGIYDMRGELVGVLVRGGDDYEKAEGRQCNVAIQVSGSQGAPWEQATYVKRAIDAMCMSGWPSKRLCDVEPSCGDGFCTMDEVGGSCAADCIEATCARPPCTKSIEPDLVPGEPVPDPDGGLGSTPLPENKSCSVSMATRSDSRTVLGISLLTFAVTWKRRRTRRL